MKKIFALLAVFMCAAFAACDAPSARSVSDQTSAAAVLTIHTFDGAYGSLPLVPNFGHSFVSVENISGGALTVGGFTLAAGHSVSVGTWATTAHTGVWYNLEAYYYELGKYDTCMTLSKRIDADSLAALTRHILNNDRWAFNYNCSAFATDAWNTAAENDRIAVKGLVTPNKLRKQISRFKTAEGVHRIETHTEAGYISGKGFVAFVPEGENV